MADPPDPAGATCDLREYVDRTEAFRRRLAEGPDLSVDPDLALGQRLTWVEGHLDALLELDRIRVACGVVVPSSLWVPSLRGHVAEVQSGVDEELDARSRRVAIRDLEAMSAPLLTRATRARAEAFLDDARRAFELPFEHRASVAAVAIPDACIRDRVLRMESWRDIERRLHGPARREAEAVAHAVGWSASDVPAALEAAIHLAEAPRIDFAGQRERTLSLVDRCPGEVPIELLPWAAAGP